jgi:hypothetical protein
MQAVPASFVRGGPLQPSASASFIVASHSVRVGSRQSPGEDPSVNMQSPSFRPAAAFFAASQFAVDKQFDCFSQISRVTVSVTVPFPQSTYRFALSTHGPAVRVRVPSLPFLAFVPFVPLVAGVPWTYQVTGTPPLR